MSKKGRTVNQRAPRNPRSDKKSQLDTIAQQMAKEDPTYRKQKEERQKRINRNWRQLMELRPALYQFMRGYKINSGIFINNFLIGRDFDEYEEDCWDIFTIQVFAKNNTFSFGDGLFDIAAEQQMIRVLSALEKQRIAYCPINCDYIRFLQVFDEAFKLHPPVEGIDTVLYRGCTSMERNGLNVIVSTSTDMKIALQFSRGTLLKIHIDEDDEIPQINMSKIRPKKGKHHQRDFENEILIPPCDPSGYEILSIKDVPKGSMGDEPNNYKNTTRVIELKIKKTRGILERFLEAMENPPEEYMNQVYPYQRADFNEAKMLLTDIIKGRC